MRLVLRHLWVICAALVLCAPGARAAQISCGQVSDRDAELKESCTGDLVIRGGRLNLAGNTVYGTIFCDAPSCEVFSSPRGGAVLGFNVPTSVGIVAGNGAAEDAGDLIIDGVTVSGFGTGIAARNVVVTNSRVAGNSWRGVEALESLDAVGVTVRGNGEDGLHARLGSVAVDGSKVSENGGSGVRALAGVIAVESTIEANGRDGIENYSKPALVISSQVRSNGRHGVRSDDSDCDPTADLDLRDSQVTGNGTSALCGAGEACGDLVSCNAPLLDDTSICDRSLQMEGTAGWSACAAD